MKYCVSVIFILLIGLVNSSSYSQNTVVSYAKGGSVSLFDLPAKAKLYNVFGLSFQKNKHTFGARYSQSNFKYDDNILSGADRLLNFSTDIKTYGLNYDYTLGSIDLFTLDIGFSLAYSDFSSYTNLQNAYGIEYQEANFSDWGNLGYPSDSDFETPFSSINPDGLSDFPENYVSFGPSVTASYEVIKNVSVYLTSIYRKNLTDLLDNTTIDNTRDISANSNDDNQFDFYVGISFNLSTNKKMDNDSLLSYIESITNDSPSTETVDAVKQTETSETLDNNITNSLTDTAIVSREDYILGFFETNDNPSTETIDVVKQTETSQLVDNNLNNDSLSREEYILSFFDFPEEDSTSSFSEESNESEKTLNKQEEENRFSNNADNEWNENASTQTCYLIVGVFSQLSNLESMANSLQIDSSNYFTKNNLYYLYILETNLVGEAKQLRNSLEIESWIYYSN